MQFHTIIFMQAHWLTVLAINFTLLFTPVYWFFVMSTEKAVKVALITVFVESLALTGLLFNIVQQLGDFGGLLIMFMWVAPASLLWANRDYFRGLDQKKLVALQIFRLLGVFFILEMSRGHIPASFALPAGIGDIIVGASAAVLCFFFKKIPRSGVIFIVFIGLLDFAMAFFFGFTSLPGPAQIFAKGFNNQINLFPTGMIPLFLVPYAIVFHVLSLINLKDYD